jgi:DNA-binding NarL/FixJ family response regulator
MTDAAPVARAFLFADLRDFTRYTDAHGDAAAAALLARYRALVRDVAAGTRGAEIRTEGDGFYLLFPSASSALGCAMTIQGRAAEDTAEPALGIAIGVHAGETSEGAEGPVGTAVNLAPRCLVPFRFVPRGSPVLKGLAEPVALYRVVTADDPLAQAPPTPAEAPRLRVVLADDAVLLRDAIAMALGAAGFEVVGQAGEVTGLLALVERTAPDVAIVDVRMPPTHTTEGLEAAREIRRLRPRTAILVLSQYVETRYALELIRDDAAGIGYLLKDRVSRVADLADAVRRVADGGSVIDPEVVGRLLGRQRTQSPIDELTPREREILGLMAEGRSNQGIADRLTLELKTVENHVGQIFSKLALEPASDDHRRVLAVLTYLRAA